MIITRISGGLGNQLFQYSVGKSLAEKNNTELILDTSFYTNTDTRDMPRHFSLNAFAISAKEMSSLEKNPVFLPKMTNQTFTGKIKRAWFRLIEYLKPLHKKKFIIEPMFIFCPDVLNAGPNCYLTGNWQSEKYFKEIENIIHSEFTLKMPTSSATNSWVAQITDCNSVSVHIRRGDYIQNEKTNKLHGTTTLSYYQKAVQIIAQKVQKPYFFVFSDDIEWAKTNFSIQYPTFFVSNHVIPDYEELIIMSNCRHNIIANSSFSWWSAWLNQNPTKIVIAPQKWFNVNTISTNDLILETWIKL